MSTKLLKATKSTSTGNLFH